MMTMNNSGAAEATFDAVLFDMDGVLVDSEELIAQSAMRMFRECYEAEVPRDAFYPYVGAAEYLRACRELGLKIALASAADLTKVRVNLRILGVEADFFDAVVTGTDIKRKKPFPDIYLLVASKVGVDIGRCLVVEDAVNGIAAGVAAGALCLGLTTSFSEEALMRAGARWCAPNLAAADLPYQLRSS